MKYLAIYFSFLSLAPIQAGAATVNLYAENLNSNSIRVFTSGVGPAPVFASGLSSPSGLAKDSNGNLYVANSTAKTIERITPGGVTSLFANTYGVPDGLTIDSQGNLYASILFENSIEKFTPGGSGSFFASTGVGPTGLAFGPNGNLYVANVQDENIQQITPDGKATIFANTGTNDTSTTHSQPYGLVFDTSGNLYLTDSGFGTINKFAPNGTESVFSSVGVGGPSGPVFDSAGNLYVANGDTKEIDRYAPDGTESVFARTGLSGPTFLALAPQVAAPEPATPGLILAGLIALAVWKYRAQINLRRGRKLANCFLLFGLAVWVNPAHASIILNETFDELTARPTVTSAGAFTAINGTNIDIVGPGYGPELCVTPESGNCVDMDGTGGQSQGVLQSPLIALSPGNNYFLSFQLVGSGRDVTSSTTVSFGPYSQTFTLTSGDKSSGIVSNALISVNSKTAAYLTFTSNTPGLIGSVLDNVSITSSPVAAAPEPASAVLFILGALGIALSMRKLPG